MTGGKLPGSGGRIGGVSAGSKMRFRRGQTVENGSLLSRPTRCILALHHPGGVVLFAVKLGEVQGGMRILPWNGDPQPVHQGRARLVGSPGAPVLAP